MVRTLFVPTYKAQAARMSARVVGSIENMASQESIKIGQEMKDRDRRTSKEIRRF